MVIKHLELFSGIGGFRKAFDHLANDFNFQTKCVGFSEIDENAIKTYLANFTVENKDNLGDIVSFVSNKKNLNNLQNFNWLTGGFPCQAFSMMGKQQGFKDIRGNVFFQIIEILKVKKTKYILLENVRNLLSHNKGETFKTIIKFIKQAGYPYVYYDIFNTADFGLAQKRNRVYIFATNIKPPSDFEFSSNVIKKCFCKIKDKTSLELQNTTLDVLEKEVDEKYYLSDILKPTILSNGTKNFKSKSEINQLLARPLTATMVKMHRACQDNYFSYDFINAKNPLEYLDIKFNKKELSKQKIRKITPKEAFLLQGFDSTFYENASKAGVSNHQLYKQAGNAVSINSVYAILYYLIVLNGFK